METRKCPRCRARVLAGVSNGGKAAGMDVQLDPAELTPLGELDAVHAGRRTWTLHSTGDVFVRGTSRFTEWPAGTGNRRTVHADHDCSARQEEGT
jgi:hypothetical protein